MLHPYTTGSLIGGGADRDRSAKQNGNESKEDVEQMVPVAAYMVYPILRWDTTTPIYSPTAGWQPRVSWILWRVKFGTDGQPWPHSWYATHIAFEEVNGRWRAFMRFKHFTVHPISLQEICRSHQKNQDECMFGAMCSKLHICEECYRADHIFGDCPSIISQLIIYLESQGGDATLYRRVLRQVEMRFLSGVGLARAQRERRVIQPQPIAIGTKQVSVQQPSESNSNNSSAKPKPVVQHGGNNTNNSGSKPRRHVQFIGGTNTNIKNQKQSGNDTSVPDLPGAVADRYATVIDTDNNMVYNAADKTKGAKQKREAAPETLPADSIMWRRAYPQMTDEEFDRMVADHCKLEEAFSKAAEAQRRGESGSFEMDVGTELRDHTPQLEAITRSACRRRRKKKQGKKIIRHFSATVPESDADGKDQADADGKGQADAGAKAKADAAGKKSEVQDTGAADEPKDKFAFNDEPGSDGSAPSCATVPESVWEDIGKREADAGGKAKSDAGGKAGANEDDIADLLLFGPTFEDTACGGQDDRKADDDIADEDLDYVIEDDAGAGDDEDDEDDDDDDDDDVIVGMGKQTPQ